jgi:hypothetical protein
MQAVKLFLMLLLTAAGIALLMPFAACSSEQPPGSGANANPSVSPALSDRITLPNPRREFLAANGKYAFVVATQDGWKSPHGTGELFAVAGGNRTSIWAHELQQQFGPRFVLVSNTGTVLMLDEWINVATPRAIVIFDRSGKLVAQHSTEAVQAVVNVPMNDIVRLAKQGWWITEPPTLNSAGDQVRVATGGKRLDIRVADGRLSLAP